MLYRVCLVYFVLSNLKALCDPMFLFFPLFCFSFKMRIDSKKTLSGDKIFFAKDLLLNFANFLFQGI